MRSRLKGFAVRVTELAPFLSNEDIQTFTDLLAVVEAARSAVSCSHPSGGCHHARWNGEICSRCSSIRAALAKLDEVQP
jgi:hypothetical protein